MSFRPHFSIDQPIGCDSFVIIDNTGDYSALTNPNGYGTPNPTRASIVSAFVDITNPNGTTAFAIPCTLPTTQPTETNITASDLLVPIEDGLYVIRYYVNDGFQDYDITETKLYYCNVQCCLDKLIAQLTIDSCCDCDNSQIDTLNKLDWYITGAILSAGCDKPRKAKKDLAAAQFLCTQKKCNCSRS